MYNKAWESANKDRRNTINRNWSARQTALMREAKEAPCADCGIQYPPWVMQFDHVRGAKEFNLANARKIGLARIRAEIEKCDVVCANCHAERTHSRLSSIDGDALAL